MIGEKLNARLSGQLDAVISQYYDGAADRKERATWSGLYEFLQKTEPDLAVMLSPFL